MAKLRVLVFYIQCSCLLISIALHCTNAQYYSGMPPMPSIPGMQNSGGMPSMPDFSGYPGFSSGPPSQQPPPQVIHEAPPQIITHAAPPPNQGMALPPSGLGGGLTRLRNRYSIGGVNPNSLRQLILPAIAMGAAFHFGRTH